MIPLLLNPAPCFIHLLMRPYFGLQAVNFCDAFFGFQPGHIPALTNVLASPQRHLVFKPVYDVV